MRAAILIMEGKSNGTSFTPALIKAGYQVKSHHTGTTAVKALTKQKPDLVVFDASSMRSSGVRTCRRLKRLLGTIPIIYIRAENQKLDKTAEADVYLQLPFTPRKLLNRIRALLPVDEVKEEIIRYGCVSLYRTKRSIEVGSRGESQLTPKLTSLLEEFIRHPNEVVTRRQLMQNVWKTDYIGDTRTLDVHIRWARELIETNPANPMILKTVRGKGYIFSMPSTQNE